MEKAAAVASLTSALSETPILYCIVRSKTGNGVRYIDAYVVHDSHLRWVGGLVAAVTGKRWDDDKEGVPVPGVGHSATDALADDVSMALFGDTGKVKGVKI